MRAPPAEKIDPARLPALRTGLLRRVHGTVVEFGAGSAETLEEFDEDVTWIGIEPDPHARHEAEERARDYRQDPPLDARAEALPLPDDSADVVLAARAFCSVDDLAAAMSEAVRVLRPGGRLLFEEHVIAPPRTGSRFAQRIATPLTARLDNNCHHDRDPVAAAEAAGFCTERVDRYALPMLGFAIPIAIYEGSLPGR